MQTGAAYVRVSTEEQLEFSPDSQIKKIREYAAGHNILLPDEFIFLDEGISGRTARKRPEFMKMIGLAKTTPKPFDVILLWKFSRFARNRQDSILYKSMLRKECGIDVVSITEQLSDDPTAILIEALLEAMDEYYSINLGQEVKRGMNEKFSRGGVVSVPPFGYCMGEKNFEIEEEKAVLVRMIYEDFLNGMPYRRIAVKLNNMGIQTNRGNAFDNRTVEYILSNPAYIGKQRRNLNGPDPADRFHRGGDVAIVEAAHKPILEEHTFTAAQKRIGDMKKIQPKYTRCDAAEFMLRGLVRCSGCGSTLTQAVKGKSLQCNKYARGQCKDSHSIRIEKLNTAVLAVMEKDFGKLELEITISGDTAHGTVTATGTILKKELQRLKRIETAYESGTDSLEEYKHKKKNISAQIKELQKKADEEKHKRKQRMQTVHLPMIELFKLLQSPEYSEGDKNELLRFFIRNIIFYSKERAIQIEYYV